VTPYPINGKHKEGKNNPPFQFRYFWDILKTANHFRLLL
jgi:hypothetical protein